MGFAPDPGLVGGDFIGFWGAGKSLSRGENPYDPVNLRRYLPDAGIQFDKIKAGDGPIDHVPFYYPPWSVYPVVALLPLGYLAARNAWLIWGLQSYLAAVYLLASRPGAFSLPMRACVFGGAAVWILPLRFGQVVGPTLLLLVLCLLAWEAGRDRWLGLFLVLAVVKPQISALPVLLVLLVAARDRRWNVWIWAGGFALALTLSAMWFRPTWLLEYLAAPRLNPPPTVVEGPGVGPQLGCSLWSGLMLFFGEATRASTRSASGNGLLVAMAIQAVVAVAILVPLGRMVWKREASVERLMSAGIVASWFLSPYLRLYDLPILCLPIMHLLNRPTPIALRAGFAFVWVALPHLDCHLDYAWAFGKDTALRTFFLWEFHWWWIAVWIGLWWLVDLVARSAESPPPEASSAAAPVAPS